MQNIKYLLDTVSFFTVVGALTKLLPPIAALMSCIWIGIQIYEWNKKRKVEKQ